MCNLGWKERRGSPSAKQSSALRPLRHEHGRVLSCSVTMAMSSPRANDWLARRRAEGATIRVLANELGVGPDRVAAAVHAAGLPPVRRNGSHPSFPELYDEDWIHAELATKTRTQVAAELDHGGQARQSDSLPDVNCRFDLENSRQPARVRVHLSRNLTCERLSLCGHQLLTTECRPGTRPLRQQLGGAGHMANTGGRQTIDPARCHGGNGQRALSRPSTPSLARRTSHGAILSTEFRELFGLRSSRVRACGRTVFG